MMYRRNFLRAAAGGVTVGIAGCSEEAGIQIPSPSPTPDRKEIAKEVPYRELNRNYEEYIGEYIHYPRVVVDIANRDSAGDGKGYQYHVYVNGVFGAGMWVEYDERFVRGDVLELWGKVTKIDNVWNQPDLVAVDMERIESG